MIIEPNGNMYGINAKSSLNYLVLRNSLIMIKARYIIRDDIKMSEAKLAIQAAHGTDLIWSVVNEHPTQKNIEWAEIYHRRKIVLKISSLEKLENLKEYLIQNKILFFDIIDEGFIEFEGRTLTGIVIPPYYTDEEISKHSKIKRLQLWK